MLTEECKRSVTNALTTLKSNMPNYRGRHSQLQLIAKVSNIIAVGGDLHPVLAADAPCGTGKTLAYSLPAIALAKQLGLKVVISTGTIALQEQLVTKDLPELAQSADLDFRFKLLKGRNRYACTSRLSEEAGQVGQGGLFDNSDLGSQGRGDLAATEYLESLVKGEWDGDFDTYKTAIEKPERDRFGATSAQCSGSKCRFHDKCPFYSARKKELVDVFVVNHDLLLSSVLSENGAIPELDDCVLIIDEAHTIGEKAVSHFSSSAHLSKEVKWAGEYVSSFMTAGNMVGIDGEVSMVFEATVNALKESIQALYGIAVSDAQIVDGLAKNKRFKKDDWVYSRFKSGEVPDDVLRHADLIRAASTEAIKQVEKLTRKIEKALADTSIGQQEGERLISAVGQIHQYLSTLGELSDGILREQENGKPWAKWMQARNTKSDGIEVVLSASPISNGGMLKALLWEKAYASILTSATLTAVGSFDSFVSEAGLYNYPALEKMEVQSPFNFQESALLEVPMMQSEPSNFDAFSSESAEYLSTELKKTLGSLVLFCSYRQMKRVYEELDPVVADVVLVQGELSRGKMLAEHAERIRNGKPSVLFGVSSLAEGLDLRRELCTQVIVVKLPFSPPDSPVEEARSEWIEERGGNPFMEIAVPRASLKLNQAVGRLLRTEDDKGRVVLLDRRLLTKRYGSMLISSLENFRQNVGGPMPSARHAESQRA